MSGVETPWRYYDFGTDLAWVENSWATPVTVGNAFARLYARREAGYSVYIILIVPGSTTVFAGGQWFFEMPAQLLGQGDAVPPISMGTGISSQQVAPFVHGVTVCEIFTSAGSPSGVALSMWAPDVGAGGGSGALTKVYPFAWAAGDFVFCTGIAPAFGN